ncbi:MAG TPA: hypothetical protein VG405_14085 [Solirubrobacteraceae bacterium]|jgi:hypothetical protein|nr:hypothetical protein [Solirubrobacteraceae bacterium]
MSDLLAIVGPASTNDALVEEIARRHPDRVTILLEETNDAEWGSDESPRGRALRDQLASLLTAIEQGTGAVVVGLAGDREQLTGWRFDRIIGGRLGGPPALPV